MILPLLLLAGKLLTGAAAAAAIAAAVTMIVFADVLQKLRQKKLHSKDVGELIRKRLANGDFKVVGSVLSNKPLGVLPRRLRHEETFIGKPDAQLEALFGGKDRIRVTL